MRKWLLLICLAGVLATPVMAQQASGAAKQPATTASQPPTTEQVMKFFEIMHIREQIQTLLQAQQKQMNVMFSDMFSKKMPEAAPEQREKFQGIMNGMMSDMFSNYPVEDILRDMIPVYQKHLTESDLSAIIAFYSSPVGKKVIQEMPAMSAEAMRVSYTRLQPRIEEMMKKMESRVDAMAKDGGTKAGPDSSAPKQ